MSELEEQHREYLLSVMRAASLRLKAWDTDLTSAGIALRADMVSADTALEWLHDAGLLWLLGKLPESMGTTFLSTLKPEQASDA